VMVMMDTVVDVLCGVMCLLSSARYIFRRLSSDSVVIFCEQILSTKKGLTLDSQNHARNQQITGFVGKIPCGGCLDSP
jgi:hypothetical protein